MAVATCQFTQGVIVGGNGQSVFGFSANQVVTMTDAGGAGATSYLWEVVSWPAPLSSAPTVTNSTAQVATVTPTLDGTYIIKLTRTEGATITTDFKFFGVVDEDGLTLPSAGQTGNMTNQSVAAQKAGWAGRANASTNSQLDAYLRFLKAKVGRYVGHIQTVAHTSGSPVTVQVTDGSSKPYRMLTLTGAGLYTEELVVSPAPGEGKTFRYWVELQPGAGGLTIKNGVGGTALLTLQAPPTGVSYVRYDLEFASNGTAWYLANSSVLGTNVERVSEEFELVAGNRSTDQTISTRIGTGTVNPSKFPSTAITTFRALIEATSGKTAEVRLYNVTDGAYVSNTLTTASDVPALVEEVVTLPAGEKEYEVVLRMTSSGGPTDRVTCTSAKLVIQWG